MTRNVVRILADWFRHPTYGVVAALAGIPIESGAVRLTTLSVLDEITDTTTALKQTPDVTPVLQVMATATPITNTSPVTAPAPPDRRVEVGARFVTKGAATETLLEQADQVLRALDVSLRALFHTPAGEAARTRNQVLFYHIEEWRTEFGMDHNDTLCTASLILTARVRDLYTAP